MAENTIFSGVVFENDNFILEIGSDGCAKRLFHKAEEREMLENTHTPMFSITQDRLLWNFSKISFLSVATVSCPTFSIRKLCSHVAKEDVA